MRYTRFRGSLKRETWVIRVAISRDFNKRMTIGYHNAWSMHQIYFEVFFARAQSGSGWLIIVSYKGASSNLVGCCGFLLRLEYLVRSLNNIAKTLSLVHNEPAVRLGYKSASSRVGIKKSIIAFQGQYNGCHSISFIKSRRHNQER